MDFLVVKKWLRNTGKLFIGSGAFSFPKLTFSVAADTSNAVSAVIAWEHAAFLVNGQQISQEAVDSECNGTRVINFVVF